MFHPSLVRTYARNLGLTGLGFATTAATATAIYTNTDDGRGLKRELKFWHKIGPVCFDYFWETSSRSPKVKYKNYVDGKNLLMTPEVRNSDKNHIMQELHKKHAPEVLNVMLDLKGLYIKLGQVLSVSPLPLPEVYRVCFRTLQSDVPGWEEFDEVVRPVIEKDIAARFGVELDDVFEFIEKTPCGAASIGQAHYAILNNEYATTTPVKTKDKDKPKSKPKTKLLGKKVIIKVQYPNALWQVPADIKCVGDFLQVCIFFNVVDSDGGNMSYNEFSKQFLAELNYEREADNLKTVYESSLDVTAPYIKRSVLVPEVYEHLCSKRVVTMGYLPGPKLEEEAKRQLRMLGLDTSKGMRGIKLKDALGDVNANTANQIKTETSDEIDPAITSNWKVRTGRAIGTFIGVDNSLQISRFTTRSYSWLKSTITLTGIRAASTLYLAPKSWESWAAEQRSNLRLDRRMQLTKGWIEALFDCHGHQIFNLGLFNSDPHPGNILILDNGFNGKNDQLGLIDYGQCKRLNEDEQYRIAKLILAVADDVSDQHIADAFRSLKIKTKNDDTKFLAELAKLMFGSLKSEYLDHKWHGRLHKLDKVISFPSELSMVYRTSLLLRGLGLSLQVNCCLSELWKGHAGDCVERVEKKRLLGVTVVEGKEGVKM